MYRRRRKSHQRVRQQVAMHALFASDLNRRFERMSFSFFVSSVYLFLLSLLRGVLPRKASPAPGTSWMANNQNQTELLPALFASHAVARSSSYYRSVIFGNQRKTRHIERVLRLPRRRSLMCLSRHD